MIIIRRLTQPFLSFSLFFQSSTHTHCDVYNFAPSISAAIGSFVPQKYIWQACISLHCAPRFLFACLLNQHLVQRLQLVAPYVKLLIRTSLLLQFLENFALLILTVVSSQANFDIHSVAFGSFVCTSFFYMIIVCFLITYCGYQPKNRYERIGSEWKVFLMKFNFVAGLLMLYFYYRHNTYCEQYVYSFFGLCEYSLVLSNIAFHGTAYYDFYYSEISVSRSVLTSYPRPGHGREDTKVGQYQDDRKPLLEGSNAV